MMFIIYSFILLSFAVLVLISKYSRSGTVKLLCFGIFILECIFVIANMIYSFLNWTISCNNDPKKKKHLLKSSKWDLRRCFFISKSLIYMESLYSFYWKPCQVTHFSINLMCLTVFIFNRCRNKGCIKFFRSIRTRL